MPKDPKYNLIERTSQFGEDVIRLAQGLPKSQVTMPLINQLLRSGTSIGANYCEADDAESKKDFKHKVGVSKKEARESVYWLKMLIVACPAFAINIQQLLNEAKELNLILNAINNKLKEKMPD